MVEVSPLTFGDHFDHAVELEDTLQQRMKATELAILEAAMIPAGKATFVRQQRPLGLGHAVACAEGVIGNEPFAVILPDMVMKGKPGCLTQMVEAYAQKGGNLIACEEAPADELHRYGVLALADAAQDIPRITGMVEKPAPGTAPSRQIVSGRYILQPEILPLLRRTKPGAGGEIQLTDAMLALLAQDDFHAVKFTGETYDCGDRLGYILANLAFALSRKALAQDLVPLAQKLLARATVDEQRKAA